MKVVIVGNIKILLYFCVAVLVIWAMDSVNINQIFKKNRVAQARVFYFLLGLAMIYLITNLIYDFFFFSQIG